MHPVQRPHVSRTASNRPLSSDDRHTEETIRQRFRSRLVRFYRTYNPSKILVVDDMLKDAVGKEEELFMALVRMYGPEPDCTIAGISNHQRLCRFYSRYNPAKLPEVDKILHTYRGREESLFAALVVKYGPEPSGHAASDEDCEDCDGDPLVDEFRVRSLRQRRRLQLGLLRTIAAAAAGTLRSLYYRRWCEYLWWCKNWGIMQQVVTQGRGELAKEKAAGRALKDR
eukprot:Sspe_Gene.11795::Locus_4002_Transcript_1_3_Confidence_0.500_Length_2467::g.11795::m.11795